MTTTGRRGIPSKIPWASSWLWVILLSCVTLDGVAGEINWNTDFDKALQMAADQEKAVVVDVYADWCGPCRMMERRTFRDEKVQKKMLEFIPLKVNADTQQDIAERYGVTGLPTTLVLNPQGGVLVAQPGYLSPHNFMVVLNAADQSIKDLDEEIKVVESQPQDLERTLALARRLLDLQRGKEALPWFERVLAGSSSNDTDIKAPASFGMGMAYASSGDFARAVDQLEGVQRDYPDHFLAKQSDDLLPMVLYFWLSQRKEKGDMEGAQKVYRKLSEQYSKNEAAMAAKELLGG